MPYKDAGKQREFQKQRMRQCRADFMKDKVCVDCGSTENLEIDHRVPADKVHHVVWSWAKDRREAELAKCDVRCNSCHLKRTLKQRKENLKTYEHGTYRMYKSEKCKCAACRKTNRDRVRLQRLNKKHSQMVK